MNTYTKLFIEYCGEGCLEKCKELVKVFKDNIDSEYAFRYATRYKKFKIAKWLVEKFDNIDIHADDDFFFRYACRYGQLDIIVWMVNTFKNINVHVRNEEAFRWVCTCGALKIAKLLMSKFKYIDIHAKNDGAFYYAYENDHLKIVKWLLYTFETYNDIEILSEFRNCKYYNILISYIERNIRLCKRDEENIKFNGNDLTERIEYIKGNHYNTVELFKKIL